MGPSFSPTRLAWDFCPHHMRNTSEHRTEKGLVFDTVQQAFRHLVPDCLKTVSRPVPWALGTRKRASYTADAGSIPFLYTLLMNTDLSLLVLGPQFSGKSRELYYLVSDAVCILMSPKILMHL